MFLPNSHSFLLVKSVIPKPVIHPVRSSLAKVSLETRAFGASETSNGIQSGIAESATSLPPSPSSDSGRKTFSPPHQNFWCGGLPNSHSFLLARSVISNPVRSKTPMASADAQEHQTSNEIQESATSLPPSSSSDSDKPTIVNKDKRTFLKVAGVAGASLVGSLLLPKKAEALIMGSSPTTGVVGVKNSTNTRINPATEETAASLLKTSDLTIDTGSLQVKVTSLPDSSFSDSGGVAKKGLVDADRHVQVDVLSSALPTAASTENTLTTINYGGKKLTLRLVTVGSIDYVGEAELGTATNTTGWRIKRIHNNYDGNSNISIAWADGVATFTKTFDSYATYTYS